MPETRSPLQRPHGLEEFPVSKRSCFKGFNRPKDVVVVGRRAPGNCGELAQAVCVLWRWMVAPATTHTAAGPWS